MFVGRAEELGLLQELYDSDHFEFLVLYGRRRVGKTSLLGQFVQGKNAIFFSAQEKNDSLNLSDFSNLIQAHFKENSYGTFSSWQNAFNYVGSHVSERLLIVIDEFPYIATENPSVKSILQHTIDLSWKNKNIFLILCGSSISFMETEVMGAKSPLFGRSTSQLEIKGFDYLDSSKFFPNYSNEEKLLAYGILGGIPCYLERFNCSNSIEENICNKILKTGSFLKDEPQVLLKMDVREPVIYNSILEAIATGSTRLSVISDKIHEETQKCSKYLNTLQNLKVVERITPVGDGETSKKGIYKIADNFFQFWYRFLFSNKSYFDIIGPEEAAREIMQIESISNYMGPIFEHICLEYMVRMAKRGELPLTPSCIGKWWGANSASKKQDDIDVLALGRDGTSAIFCECKFRNTLFDKTEFEDLITASSCFSQVERKFYYLFSKSGFTKWVLDEASARPDVKLITLKDLFQC